MADYDQTKQQVYNQYNADKIYIALSSVVGPNIALLVLDALRGAGLVLIILGVLLFLAGFGAFAYVIVSFITVGFSTLQSPNSAKPPDLSGIPFVPLLPLGAGLAFLGIVVGICGFLLFALRVTRAVAKKAGMHQQRTPEVRPEEERPRGLPQPHRAKRAVPYSCVLALLFPVILLALSVVGLRLVRGDVFDLFNRWGVALPAVTTQVNGRVFIVANTGGEGVYLRSTTRRVDCRPRPLPAGCVGLAYLEGTRLMQIGPDATNEGQTWHHVRAPDGKEGWVPAEYTLDDR